MKVEESLNVIFDETPPSPKTSPLEDDNLVEEEAIEVNKTRPFENDVEDKSLENNEIINIKESKSHPLENVIEPKNINEVLKDESWVIAMQEELNQFISNDVWELFSNPKDMAIIGTKWLYRNKLDENGVVSRNKARLVAPRYSYSAAAQFGFVTRRIKVLRSDRGGEYLSIEFFDHLKNCGIVSHLSPPRTPQLNGVAERRNKTLLDMVRSMMCRATLPISFWGYALETAAHI
ncbi:retrovirus-related pol polyprotein from transposon TNT 1-94 [Tanacetum coccineum]|uniref:Retrovirus-related pol polyprotein from transposon TNT 1-94 n=1 Tax=Tanacetum coccineum TaxID=301880 RepID=A0ABQ5JAV2_9ASTR